MRWDDEFIVRMLFVVVIAGVFALGAFAGALVK